MVLNILMAACMYPVFLVMYVVMKKHVLPQKGRCFSVTFQPEWVAEEETGQKIEEVKKSYLKGLRNAFLFSVIVPVICFIVPYVSIQITIWCLWIFVVIVLYYIPFVKANKALRQWKETKGWATGVSPTLYVELKGLDRVRCVKWKQYIAPLLIISLTAVSGIVYRTGGRAEGANPVYETCFWIFFVTFWFSIVMFAAISIMMDRRGVEVISRDSDVNLNYGRAKKYVWKVFWQGATWSTVAIQVAIAAMLWAEMYFLDFVLWGIVVYTIWVLVGCVWIAGKFARVDAQYRDKMDADLFADDDKYWIGGIIYYNPNDNRSMVETRVGVGTTTNMAKPLGKVLDAIAVVTILYCGIMCAWVILEEFTPISLEIHDANILAEHVGPEYEIPLEEIIEISYVTELPKMSKTNGSAMEHLRKGKFYISEERRKCIVFLNPLNELFVRVRTEDMVYYIGGIDDAQTSAVYDEIVELIE